MLALGLALASLPLVITPPAAGSRMPCLSADICHPLQSLDRAGDVAPMARPALAAREQAPAEFSKLPEYLPPALAELILTPDPPPPKAIS